ncbi:MFS transporter [Gallibacterium salpingitidis]|uniref:MFS transporter n=1 Tax=Gallibacterium salpingitidis TaxID=505341 RepID=UPI000805B7C4|nr:MFS transporter [Gallibacterium salpingitidis]OBX04720.1 MFS transporter [Gallibacterium salpingitidis]WKT00567.1 MFS transporter [Gallibacterium salpingitidis]
MKKQNTTFLILGIIMIGVVLRVPFTAIPPILQQIADEFAIPISSLGILTTLPLLMFALVSPFAARLGQIFGIEKLFALVLILMILGSTIRIFSLPLLFTGTIIIGIGIAVLNVLLPSAIMANYPSRLGKLTSLYSLAMTFATIIGSSLAIPITQMSNWQTMILVLSAILLLALVIWLPNVKHNHYLEKPHNQSQKNTLFKNKYTWCLVVFGGLQSLYFYTTLAWLPTMGQQAGLSASTTGYLLGIYMLVTIPLMIFLPSAFIRWSSRTRQLVVAGFISISFIGVAMMLLNYNSFTYWLLVNIFTGLAGGALFPYLLTMLSVKTTSPTNTARLSGIVQSGGYLLAACGPILFGYGYGFWHSWVPQTWILLILVVIMAIAAWFVEQTDKII